MKILPIPKKDDMKNFHFLYVCKKQEDPVMDTDEEEELKKQSKTNEGSKVVTNENTQEPTMDDGEPVDEKNE